MIQLNNKTYTCPVDVTLEFISQWGITYLKKHGIDYLKDQHLYK